ncbi:MAG: hypothetical protein AAF602_08110, partial [Myxococcota bacterium]
MKQLMFGALLSLSAMAACTQGGEGACDVDVDTDGDGLTDCRELEIGTWPTVADSDGDSFDDGTEVANWDRGGPFHLRFNPLVADVPRLQLTQQGPPEVQLWIERTEEDRVAFGLDERSEDEVVVTSSRGGSNERVIEAQHTVGVNGSVRTNGVVTVGQIDASYQYEHTDTNTSETHWNQSEVARNRREVGEFYEEEKAVTTEETGGSIKVTLGLANDGDVSYTLQHLDLTASMRDPRDPSRRIPVGTLRHDGDIRFTPSPLGRGAEIAPGDLTSFVFSYDAPRNPSEIARVLENSDQLVIEPASMQLVDDAGLDFGRAADDVAARTMEVVLDFGDLSPTERYRVAVAEESGARLSLADVLTSRLNVAYELGEDGFTRVRDITNRSDGSAYWMATLTVATANPGVTETTLYHPLFDGPAPGAIEAGRGDVLHLLFIEDQDLDGLSDRYENDLFTDPTSVDTDGDGLDDAVEVFGWMTDLEGPDCGDSSQVRVFSDPTSADTDGDGMDDLAEQDACTNPRGDLAVDAGGPVRVVQADEEVLLLATPANYLDSTKLRYTWTQLGGPSVGPLDPGRVLDLPASGEVGSLTFEVMVTDTTDPDLVATDTVRLLVVDDVAGAVFVDLADGRDSQLGTYDEPLRTLAAGVEVANAINGDVYLKSAAEPYQMEDSLVLQPGVDLFGGFLDGWDRDPDTHRTLVQVHAPVALSAHDRTDTLTVSGVVLRACGEVEAGSTDCPRHPWDRSSSGIDASGLSSLVLDHATARGGDLLSPVGTVTDTSLTAGSSYGVRAHDVGLLDIRHSDLVGGSGADGASGAAGQPGGTGSPGGPASGRTGGSVSGNVTPGSGGASGGGGAAAPAFGCTNGGRGGSVSGGATGGAGGRFSGCGNYTSADPGQTGQSGSSGAAGSPGSANQQFTLRDGAFDLVLGHG